MKVFLYYMIFKMDFISKLFFNFKTKIISKSHIKKECLECKLVVINSNNYTVVSHNLPPAKYLSVM